MEEAKEKTLQRETASIEVSRATTAFSDIDENVQLALKCAADKKALGLVALDLRGITELAEYFIIASGANQKQAQAISDEIEEQLKKLGTKPVRIEGYSAAEWILLDYGDFIVHVFDKDARGFYDLERLWRDAKRVEVPSDL